MAQRNAQTGSRRSVLHMYAHSTRIEQTSITRWRPCGSHLLGQGGPLNTDNRARRGRAPRSKRQGALPVPAGVPRESRLRTGGDVVRHGTKVHAGIHAQCRCAAACSTIRHPSVEGLPFEKGPVVKAPATTQGIRTLGANAVTQSVKVDAAGHAEPLAAGGQPSDVSPKHGCPRIVCLMVGYACERAQGDNVDAERHGESPVAARGLSRRHPTPGRIAHSLGNSTVEPATQHSPPMRAKPKRLT